MLRGRTSHALAPCLLWPLLSPPPSPHGSWKRTQLVFVNVFVVLPRVITSHSRILSPLALHCNFCRVGGISFAFLHEAGEQIQRLRYYLSRVPAGVLLAHPPVKDFLISACISFFLLLLFLFFLSFLLVIFVLPPCSVAILDTNLKKI